MKLPARPGTDALTLVDAAAAAAAARRAEAAGWRRVDAPGAVVDLSAWRNAYAAVRLAGEADAPDAEWCCALDPVRLAADMRDVRLVEWPVASLDDAACGALLSAARALLRDDPDPRVRRLTLAAPSPSRWYLAGARGDALQFELASPDALFGQPLRRHKPAGPDGPLLQRLMTELQMVFHGITDRAGGAWPHGAGAPPPRDTMPLPPLASDDAFWRACWRLVAPDAPRAPLPAEPEATAGAVLVPRPGDAMRWIDAALDDPGIATLHVVDAGGIASYRRPRALRRWLERWRR